MIGARPPLQTKHVWPIRTKLQMDGEGSPSLITTALLVLLAVVFAAGGIYILVGR
jgi:hypothetical protein